MDKSSALERAWAAADRADWSQVWHCLAEVPSSDLAADALLALSLRALADDDLGHARAIAGLLNYEQSVPALLSLVKESDPEVQWFGVQLLSKCPPRLVVPELASYLQNVPNPELAEPALQALVLFGSAAIEQLQILLATPESKMAAVAALARIRHSQTIEPLLSIAIDPEPVARSMAVEALGSFHDQRIPPLLLERLADPDAAVRQAAVVGLGLRSDLATTLGLVAHLRPLLADAEPSVAIAAAAALGRMDADGAVAALAELQPDWNSELGRQVLRALGWMNRGAAVDALEKILVARPPEPAAIEAIRALGQQQASADRASVALMKYWAGVPAGFGIRSKQEIATALGNLRGHQLVNDLVQMLSDPDVPVRWQAIYCLQQQDRSVRAHLQKLAKDPNLLPELRASLDECLKGWPID